MGLLSSLTRQPCWVVFGLSLLDLLKMGSILLLIWVDLSPLLPFHTLRAGLGSEVGCAI